MLRYFKKFEGFTIAEIIITLGIIGVISAMTLPMIIHRYQAVSYRSRLLKSHALIQQVIRKMDAEGDSLDPSTYKSKDGELFYQTFKKHLAGAMDCGNYYNKPSTGLPCYDFKNKKYKNYSGSTNADSSYLDAGQLVLPDGTLLMFENMDGVFISVDINGTGKLPNRWGYDLFTFQLLDSRVLPMGELETKFNDIDKYCNKTSSTSINGIACTSRAIKDTNYFREIVN